MTNTLPVVFIVEDDPATQNRYARALQGFVTIIPTTSIDEAEVLWNSNKDIINLVVMDGCVPKDTFSTPPLVAKIRETFTGPILAASSSQYCRDVLMKAGCTHAPERKNFVPALVLEILNIKK